MKKCEKCAFMGISNFCPKCGGKMMEMNIELNEIADDACQNIEKNAESIDCRQEYEQSEFQNGNTNMLPVVDTKNKNGLRVKIIIGAITAAIITTIIFLAGSFKTTYSDFLGEFERYLQGTFPGDAISIEYEGENFWICFGDEKAASMFNFIHDGEKICDGDKEMEEEAESIWLTGSFLEYDAEQSVKIFGGFIDYLSKDVDGYIEGAQIVQDMVNEYAENANQIVERKMDKGEVTLIPSDLNNSIICIIFTKG